MMKANKILILGNSITRHPGLKDSGWPGINWGMAASAPEKDYVHLLLRRFTDAAGGRAPKAMVENLADFEREHAFRSFSATFEKCAAFRADIVILAIGENVPALGTAEAENTYRKALVTLLTGLKQDGAPALFVRSSFWPDKVKDDILKQVCAEMGGVFVDISRLSTEESNYARSERAFTSVGVANHPGDKGMQAIAEAIWSAIEQMKKAERLGTGRVM